MDQLRRGRTKFTLGAYRVVDAIAGGGMGHVFKAEHELLGRIEAIKVLPRSRTTAEAIAGFRHEIRAQAQLDHPNLVRVTYADRDGDTYFFVTEFVPGIDLRRLIRRRGALAEDVAAAVIAQTADAIEYAHRRGLVHRDVKPGNLLLTPEGKVKVTDLGLAWYLDRDGIAAPQGVGKVVGTSDYLAPESIKRPDWIAPVSDIYSMGCTLYYAITGKVPFPGGAPMDKMRRHVKEDPADPRRFSPELSPAMVGLVQGMMAKDPEGRVASAGIVAATLRELHDGDSILRLSELVEETSNGSWRETVGDSRGGSSSGAGSSHGDGAYESDGEGLPETVGLPLDDSEMLALGQSRGGDSSERSLTAACEETPADEPNAPAEDRGVSTIDRTLNAFTVVACTAAAMIALVGLLVRWLGG